MASIYDMRSGYPITEGLQSSEVCDEAIIIARDLALTRGHSVIVYDGDECYRVTPSGRRWKAPPAWAIAWRDYCAEQDAALND